jgi:hypothetical protein
MADLFATYSKNITTIFSIGVDVLNGSRALKNISLDLKLLAINGIVQAAKIGTNQGQSLITLSGFLSDLPVQIAPELKELEDISSNLAAEITLSSIYVKKFLQYTITLSKYIDNILKPLKTSYSASDFNLLNVRDLERLHRHEVFTRVTSNQLQTLRYFADNNIIALKKINEMLFDGHTSFIRARTKIDNITRNGVIANYMGSNILIEASYLTDNQRSFEGLVNNIKLIINTLDSSLYTIQEMIIKGDNTLTQMINLRNS